MQTCIDLFEGIEDSRISNATRHDLHDMLMIGLLTIICGGEGCSDMAIFGREKEDFLRRFLRLEHGIPSHDAFSDLFCILDPAGLQHVLLRLVKGWGERFGEDVIAIDGKALRRSFVDASRPLQARPSLFSARYGFPTSQTRSRPCRPFWTSTAGP